MKSVSIDFDALEFRPPTPAERAEMRRRIREVRLTPDFQQRHRNLGRVPAVPFVFEGDVRAMIQAMSDERALVQAESVGRIQKGCCQQ